jgi:hypothetical protein
MSKRRKRKPLTDDELRLIVAGIAIVLVLMMLAIYKLDL